MSEEKANIAIIGLSGESLFFRVDTFLKPGETKTADTFYTEPGGKGFNQAVCCKMLGNNVSFLTALGDDLSGKYCLEYLRDLKIDVKVAVKEKKTAACVIVTDKKGENKVLLDKGAFLALKSDDIDDFMPYIKNADVLLLTNEIPLPALRYAFIKAKEYGIPILYNNSPAISVSQLPYIPYLTIVNAGEAKAAYNLPLNKIKADNLIVTLGKRGCLHITTNDKEYYRAQAVDAVDSTGAGDVFLASVASMFGKNIKDAIRFAMSASQEHVKYPYVINAMLKSKILNK